MPLKDALGFFTTIPVESDIENLRKNLWFLPIIGAIVGVLVSIPVAISIVTKFDIRFFTIVAYIAVEGVNHIDGLADFGDAFFAPENRKKIALKDTKIGTGGVVFVVVYLLLLFTIFSKSNLISIIISQIFAKYAMLMLLVFSKPSWEGMASYMMEYAKFRDAIIGTILIAPSLLYEPSIPTLFFVIIVTFTIKKYAERKFGGISGDVLGATNCIVFITSLYLLSFATKNPAVLWRWG